MASDSEVPSYLVAGVKIGKISARQAAEKMRNNNIEICAKAGL